MSQVIQVPDCQFNLTDGNIVKLGRFDDRRWRLGYGWYTWGGNRPFCGWYLTDVDTLEVKPLQKPDLDDIYIIEA